IRALQGFRRGLRTRQERPRQEAIRRPERPAGWEAGCHAARVRELETEALARAITWRTPCTALLRRGSPERLPGAPASKPPAHWRGQRSIAHFEREFTAIRHRIAQLTGRTFIRDRPGTQRGRSEERAPCRSARCGQSRNHRRRAG